jgi:putative membrane protein
MSTKAVNYEKKYKTWIWIVSILIPVVVALLFMVRIPDVAPLTFLPPIYAVINGITAIVLMIAYWAIRQKNISLHEQLMKTSIGLSLIFLVMYVAYHMTSDPTPYGGEGMIRYVYYFILISHIFLSIGIILKSKTRKLTIKKRDSKKKSNLKKTNKRSKTHKRNNINT